MKILSSTAPLIFIFAVAAQARAMMVGPAVQPGGLEQSCFLTQDDPGNQFEVYCSGTLVAPQLVLTARHCVLNEIDQPAKKIQVQCGFQGSQTSNDPRDPKVVGNFKESFVSTHYRYDSRPDFRFADEPQLDPNDYALIELPSLSRIAPLSMLEFAKAKKFLFSREQVECRMEGFGVSHKGVVGALKHAEVPPPFVVDELLNQSNVYRTGKTLSEREQISSYYSQQEQVGFSVILEELQRVDPAFYQLLAADSGGGLFCRAKGAPDWLLIGSAIAFGVELAYFTESGLRIEAHGLSPSTRLHWAKRSVRTLFEIENHWAPIRAVIH